MHQGLYSGFACTIGKKSVQLYFKNLLPSFEFREENVKHI